MLDQQALEKILRDPNTTEEERATAQMQLETLDPKSPLTEAEERAVDLCGPLALDILRFSGANELSEVSWRDLIRFTDSREWPGRWGNNDVQRLWLGWTVWVGWQASPIYQQQIWNAIKEEFATDQERRAEFERMNRTYPLFNLDAADDPHELEMYERHLSSSDRDLILAITRKKFDEAREYNFRTREVAQRIIAKLQGEKMQIKLTNDELYRRMKELQGKLGLSANRESQASEFQTTPLYKEVRRRADADAAFESLIPVELMPFIFPERFREVQP
jgi:hypothetical protein